MSAPQFTPGPWEWWDDGESLVRITEAAEQKLIARTVLPSNARLIAAAPELLDAGEETLDTLTKLRADLTEENAELHAQRIAVIDLTIAQLDAAIAKARGGQ